MPSQEGPAVSGSGLAGSAGAGPGSVMGGPSFGARGSGAAGRPLSSTMVLDSRNQLSAKMLQPCIMCRYLVPPRQCTSLVPAGASSPKEGVATPCLAAGIWLSLQYQLAALDSCSVGSRTVRPAWLNCAGSVSIDWQTDDGPCRARRWGTLQG